MKARLYSNTDVINRKSVMIKYLTLPFCLGFLSIVQLSAQRVPGQSYFSKNKYIEYIAGDIPIILVSPHGGELSPDSLPTIHSRGNDRGSRETTLSLMDSINAQTGGCKPHVIINHVHTSKLNMARSKDSAGINAAALEAWDVFHSFIDEAKAKVSQTWQKGHYFEMHGNGRVAKWNEIGLGVSKEYLNHSDSAILTRLSKSTIKNMADSSNFIELVRGSTSLGGLLQGKGWKSTPSPVHPTPGANFFYAGWNTWKHGSRYSGTIDATHIENYYHICPK